MKEGDSFILKSENRVVCDNVDCKTYNKFVFRKCPVFDESTFRFCERYISGVGNGILRYSVEAFILKSGFLFDSCSSKEDWAFLDRYSTNEYKRQYYIKDVTLYLNLDNGVYLVEFKDNEKFVHYIFLVHQDKSFSFEENGYIFNCRVGGINENKNKFFVVIKDVKKRV